MSDAAPATGLREASGRGRRARPRVYADKLGLRPFGEHSGHLHYAVNGAYFIVFPSSGTPSGTHDQPGFVVDDIERTVAELRASGVAFEPNGIADFGDVKAAWFRDSEGNLISVAEFGAGSPFTD